MKSSDAEMKERKALAGSSTQVTNYRDWAEADIGLQSQGRHAAAAKATVTGSARVPLYPAASGPWNDPVQVPDEPPLGYSVQDDLEPTGTPVEIAASVAIPSNDAASAREVDATPPPRAAPTSGSMSPREVGVTPSPEPGLRRGRKL
jgi:hypothetical protein